LRALITGFEPFGRWSENPSGEAATALGGMPGIVTAVLPVDHAAAADALRGLIAQHRPRAILMTGLAPDPEPRLEVLARRPEGIEGAPVLMGLWPWAAALDAMRRTGARPRLSHDAGRYVCETVYWTALDARRGLGAATLAGFLHVPPRSADWPPERHVSVIAACLSAAE
jgi:pyroglutamyl-peptidase